MYGATVNYLKVLIKRTNHGTEEVFKLSENQGKKWIEVNIHIVSLFPYQVQYLTVFIHLFIRLFVYQFFLISYRVLNSDINLFMFFRVQCKVRKSVTSWRGIYTNRMLVKDNFHQEKSDFIFESGIEPEINLPFIWRNAYSD